MSKVKNTEVKGKVDNGKQEEITLADKETEAEKNMHSNIFSFIDKAGLLRTETL